MLQSFDQKISQFIDDDLERGEALELLTTMQQRPDLQAKLRRYALLQHALKSESVLVADTDFAARVRQQLEAEPLYLLPRRKQSTASDVLEQPAVTAVVTPLPVTEQRNLRPKLLGFSLVAAIVMAVVVVPSIMNNMTRDKVLMLSHQERIKEDPANDVRLYPVNRRFQDYLQAHNSSLYTNGDIGVHTQAQFANFEAK